MSTPTITRRAALTGTAAGAAALVAGPGPALAVQTPDPIFAAIEAHKAAGERFSRAVEINMALEVEIPNEAAQTWISAWSERIVETDDPRWIASERERRTAGDLVFDLAWAFVNNPPTTIAGAAALMAYISELDDWAWPEEIEQDVYRMLAGALGRIAGGGS